MGKKYIDPPVFITEVLDAALVAIGSDKRFRAIPGGHMDIAWCQPSKKPGDERPERYRITIECAFRPSSTTDASGVLQEEPPSPSVEAHPEPRKEPSVVPVPDTQKGE